MYFINNCSVSKKLCKTTFLHIHVVSNSRLDQDQSKAGGSPPTDQHGYHRPDNKTSDFD